MWKSDYFYNNGRVFNNIFYLDDDSTIKTYFVWLLKKYSWFKLEMFRTSVTYLVIFRSEICDALNLNFNYND